MIELNENIWGFRFDGCWRCIPINCQINVRGELVMGKGVAKEAKERYPKLPKAFADSILDQQYRKETIMPVFRVLDGEIVNLIGFPTKHRWQEPSDLQLIETGLNFLRSFLPYLVSDDGEKAKIVCPKLGCGLGGLNYERQVRPLIKKYFDGDNNFIVLI